MPVFGRLSDRKGRKLFISLGLFFYSIVSLLFIGANTVIHLSLIRLLHGVTAGMIMPIAHAYIGDVAPKGEEGKWMGYFNASFFTGFAIGPLMGGVLTDHFSMTAAFSTMSGLNMLAFVVVLIFLPEISQRKLATRSRLSFREISTSGIIKGLLSFRLTFSLGRGAFATFLPIIAAIYIGLSPTLIGITLTVYMLLTSILQAYSGNIADRFNRRALVGAGCLINLSFLAFIPLTHSFWQLLVLCVFGSLGGAIAIPAASALAVEEGRRYGMGSIMGLFAMALSIGMGIGPLLSGVINDTMNINSVFYFAATMVLIGASLFTWFTRPKLPGSL